MDLHMIMVGRVSPEFNPAVTAKNERNLNECNNILQIFKLVVFT